MTNFTQVEFGLLLVVKEGDVYGGWNLGRGRKSKPTAKPTETDAMFMMLTILKHLDTWDKHAADFGLNSNNLERTIYKLLTVIEPILFKKFVKLVSMTEQRQDGMMFRNYPYALYASDVKFQPAYCHYGQFAEKTLTLAVNTNYTATSWSVRWLIQVLLMTYRPMSLGLNPTSRCSSNERIFYKSVWKSSALRTMVKALLSTQFSGAYSSTKGTKEGKESSGLFNPNDSHVGLN
ncbi:hypothetical protein PHMEG_00022698 [Phytophthora megakarya]|uniref:Uncharacterized protein n=1 Tax=Phytophthora megakarya TaxID=4795 RepID=A0A225VK41_9STRA|nr:hypothetical protein PHMEG_00022698 [Phytophthora megakarya]